MRVVPDRADGADWGRQGGLGRTRRTGRTWADGADWGTGRLDGADCGRRGGLGRTGRSRADGGGWASSPDGADWGGGGRIGSSLEGRKERTGDYSEGAIPLLGVPRGFQEC